MPRSSASLSSSLVPNRQGTRRRVKLLMVQSARKVLPSKTSDAEKLLGYGPAKSRIWRRKKKKKQEPVEQRDDEPTETYVVLSDEDQINLYDKIMRNSNSPSLSKQEDEQRDVAEDEQRDDAEDHSLVTSDSGTPHSIVLVGAASEERLSVDVDDADLASDSIVTSLSSISASDLPVRESQPIGGPKYYIATNTKRGRARVVHEAMPSDVSLFISMAEEIGYEILEYDLVRKAEEEEMVDVAEPHALWEGCFSDTLCAGG